MPDSQKIQIQQADPKTVLCPLKSNVLQKENVQKAFELLKKFSFQENIFLKSRLNSGVGIKKLVNIDIPSSQFTKSLYVF